MPRLLRLPGRAPRPHPAGERVRRLNQELQRCMRVVRVIPNRGAVERLVTALAQREEWVSGQRYLDREPFWEEWRHPATSASLAQAAGLSAGMPAFFLVRL